MQPLRQLAGVVQTILQTGRFEARVPVSGSRDPLDQLGALFNAMLDRIASLVAGMRGSLDNVAHDLRTPMTRLRSIAERALESGGDDPARYREALADCLEESERVSEMLNTLMDISEAETGVMRLAPEPLDAAHVLDDVVDLYADVAEDKGVRLVVEAAEGVTMMADRSRMRQVLANLVDNAVKFTPAGGTRDAARPRAGRRNGDRGGGQRRGDYLGGSAADLGASVSRRPQPVGTGPRARAQPGAGDRRSARRPGGGEVLARPGCHVQSDVASRARVSG